MSRTLGGNIEIILGGNLRANMTVVTVRRRVATTGAVTTSALSPRNMALPHLGLRAVPSESEASMVRKRLVCWCAAVVVVSVLAGCGGGGDSVAPPAQVGTASGNVDLSGGSAEGLRLVLNGAPLPVAVQVDGSFEIPNLPPGDYILDVLDPDDLSAGRANFHVEPGLVTVLPVSGPSPAGR